MLYIYLYFWKKYNKYLLNSHLLKTNVVTKHLFLQQVVTPSHKALNESLAKKVWEKSEALVGLKPEEKDF